MTAAVGVYVSAQVLGDVRLGVPGVFAILSCIEHGFGIWHVMGGLSEISEAKARVYCEYGVELRLSTPVRQLMVEGPRWWAWNWGAGNGCMARPRS